MSSPSPPLSSNASAPPATGWLDELRATSRLAAPLALAFAGNTLMGVTDTLVAGNIGETTLAAVGLGGSLWFIVVIFFSGVIMGLDPLIAQARGRGDVLAAGAHLEVGQRLAWWLTVPAVLLLFALTAITTAASGLGPPEQDALWVYVAIRAPAYTPWLLFVCYRSALQAWNRTRPIAGSMIVANILNVPLSFGLGFGDGALTAIGLPPIGLGDGLGVAGIAIATSVVAIAQAVVLGRAVRAMSVGFALDAEADGSPPGARPSQETPTDPLAGNWRPVWRLGWPVGLQYLAEVAVFGGSTILMSLFGATAVGGHQIALQLSSLMFTACLGISNAASVRCGMAVGRGDRTAFRRAGLVAVGLGLVIMAGSATVFLTIPEVLAGVMTQVEPVQALAVTLLGYAAAFQLFDGVQAVAAGALRGAGDTQAAMRIALLGYWGLTAPVGLVLAFALDWGPTGLWAGMIAGLAATSVMLGARLWYISGAGFARVVLPLAASGASAHTAPNPGEAPGPSDRPTKEP